MSKRIGIPMGIIIVAALVFCLAPLKTEAYTVMVDYEDTETYYEDEPYEVVETYTESVPLDYEVVDSEAYLEGTTAVASVTVRNKDDVAGTFTIDLLIMLGCTFIEPGSIRLTSVPLSYNEELYLKPNKMGTVTHSFAGVNTANCGFSSWHYEATPSTKEVEKERTVTKYRQVEKQRTVTKQRPETRYKKVTLLDYLLHTGF